MDLHRQWSIALRECYSKRDPHHDSFTLDRSAVGIDLTYISRQKSWIRCRMDPRLRHLWICNLEVTESFRRRGIGSELVRTVELFGQSCHTEAFWVFPLLRATRFWRQRGYQPAPGKYRLLTKPSDSPPPVRVGIDMV